MNFWGRDGEIEPKTLSHIRHPQTNLPTTQQAHSKVNSQCSGPAVHGWPWCPAVIEYQVPSGPVFPDFLSFLWYLPYPRHGIDLLLARSLCASLPLSSGRQADPDFFPVMLIYYFEKKKEQYQVLSATQFSFCLKFWNLVLHCIFLLLDRKF